MLKARFTSGLILLGLTDENINRLRDDMPILFPGEQVGVPGVRIAIYWGEDEDALKRKLEEQGIEVPETDRQPH